MGGFYFIVPIAKLSRSIKKDAPLTVESLYSNQYIKKPHKSFAILLAFTTCNNIIYPSFRKTEVEG